MAVINAEIPELEAFLAVAETGGFREAADRLDVSQPAVSNRIKRLEAKVGLRLLDRTTRRVELTEAGARFVEKAAVAVRGMSGLIDEFREEAATKHGRIKVAVAASLASATWMARCSNSCRPPMWSMWAWVATAITDLSSRSLAAITRLHTPTPVSTNTSRSRPRTCQMLQRNRPCTCGSQSRVSCE